MALQALVLEALLLAKRLKPGLKVLFVFYLLQHLMHAFAELGEYGVDFFGRTFEDDTEIAHT